MASSDKTQVAAFLAGGVLVGCMRIIRPLRTWDFSLFESVCRARKRSPHQLRHVHANSEDAPELL